MASGAPEVHYLRSLAARREAPPTSPAPSSLSSLTSSSPYPSTPSHAPSPLASPLPSYKWLSRFLYAQLSALHDEALLTHPSPPPPLLLPEVVDLVVDFLWEPLITPSLGLNPTHYTHHPIPPSTRAHCTGRVHADTVVRDDWSEELRLRVMRGWRIRAIRYWGNVYANGLQVVYGGGGGQGGGGGEERWQTDGLYGSHHQPKEEVWELEEGERIRQVRVEYDVWMHRVVMETSRGRMLEMGRAEPPMVRSPLVRKALLPEVQGEEYEVLAFITGVGGHIHHLGVYYHRVR